MYFYIKTSTLYHLIAIFMSALTQPNEPFLIANIQNNFADFPYPLYSIYQKLLT